MRDDWKRMRERICTVQRNCVTTKGSEKKEISGDKLCGRDEQK